LKDCGAKNTGDAGIKGKRSGGGAGGGGEHISGIEQLDQHRLFSIASATEDRPSLRFLLDFTLGALSAATLFLFLK
jgi:hypothetical protein